MKKRKFDRTSSWRCVEYWVARGFTADDAVQQISQKQSEISAKQKGKTVSATAKQNMRAAALKRNTDDYWHDRFGNDADVERTKYKQRLSENAKRSIRTRDNSSSTPRRKEFWLKRGYNESQAAEKVAEVQATFTLSKCISRYGTHEGTEVWNKRQQQWRNSFSQNDVDRMNAKRRMNANIGVYTQNNIPNHDLLFYVLLIAKDDEQWIKYGLTKHTVLKRWGRPGTKLPYMVLYCTRLPANRAIGIETSIKDQFGTQHNSQCFQLTELVPLTGIDEFCKILNSHDIDMKEILNERLFSQPR